MDLNFKIQYKQGATNSAADALSRNPDPMADPVAALSSPTPTWLERLKEGYATDPQCQQLLTELCLASPNDKRYSLVDGTIKFHGRVWVGSNQLAQQHILQALHASGIGGHSGIQATYHRVKSLFAWPKLKETVTQFVQACTVCQLIRFVS